MGKKRSWFHGNKQARKAETLSTEYAKEKKRRTYRNSFLVEEVYETSRLQGVIVLGTIHGKIREGDTMYLYQPDEPVREVHVLALEAGPREMLESAKNGRVGICIDVEKEEEVQRFAVLSSVKPVDETVPSRIVENPRLLGLMMEYARLYTNKIYMDVLLYELCETKFLIPLYMGCPPMLQEDGTFGYGKDAPVGFRSLKDHEDPEKTVFPAFTDQFALSAWKDAFSKGQPRQVVAFFLPGIIHYVEKGHTGLVVNPFGPGTVKFPTELLKFVQNTEVYKRKFANVTASNGNPYLTVEKNASTEEKTEPAEE